SLAACGGSDGDTGQDVRDAGPPQYDAGTDASPPTPTGCLPAESTACDVFVSPTAGKDGNPGTRHVPVRTLKKALTIAKAGQTVSLADGTYDAANGETWPEKVPDGVTLDAVNPGRVVINGGPEAIGLEFIRSGRVQGLSFGGFRTAIAASTGSLLV